MLEGQMDTHKRPASRIHWFTGSRTGQPLQKCRASAPHWGCTSSALGGSPGTSHCSRRSVPAHKLITWNTVARGVFPSLLGRIQEVRPSLQPSPRRTTWSDLATTKLALNTPGETSCLSLFSRPESSHPTGSKVTETPSTVPSAFAGRLLSLGQHIITKSFYISIPNQNMHIKIKNKKSFKYVCSDFATEYAYHKQKITTIKQFRGFRTADKTSVAHIPQNGN